jgi:hypothetical protein
MKTHRGISSRAAFISMWMVFILLWGEVAAAELGTGTYGRPVQFALNAEIKYPDFSVRFVGTRREVLKAYPRGFLYYDFEVLSSHGTNRKVAWSSGTGELGPREFSVDGEKYFLEMKANSLETDPKKSRLKEDEMIIWKRDVYLKKQEELRSRRE